MWLWSTEGSFQARNRAVVNVLEGYPHGLLVTGRFLSQNEQNGSHSNIPKSDAKKKHGKYQRHRAWEKEWVKKPQARVRFLEKSHCNYKGKRGARYGEVTF